MPESSPRQPPDSPPDETADKVARSFFGAGQDKASRTRTLRQLLLAAVLCGIFIPVKTNYLYPYKL